MNESDSPLLDAVADLVRQKPARFFMPGHKGNPAAMPLFGGVFPFDITEVEGADNLMRPTGPIAQSEANMTRVYGSGATLYSASGSTSCILAMLAVFTRPGQTVAMARGCHAAAVRALVLLDLTPAWLLPQGPQPTPAEAEALLKRSGARVLYLTSPNYYGQMADIAGIAAVCREHEAVLLVDNAHGAHLRFLKKDCHPLSLGADAACDSAHKTLPCLTPAAMLHLKNAERAYHAREMLNLFSSTSPSYLVLQSLDWAACVLMKKTLEFEKTAVRFSAACGDSRHLIQKSDDPLKMCFVPARGGWKAKEMEMAFAQAGIVPELADGRHIVLMASPYNTEEEFDRLHASLCAFTCREPLPLPSVSLALPRVACGVREAFFAKKEQIEAEKCAGRVAAGVVAPCPPGVPLAVPGEVLEQEVADLLVAGGILTLDVLK